MSLVQLQPQLFTQLNIVYFTAFQDQINPIGYVGSDKQLVTEWCLRHRTIFSALESFCGLIELALLTKIYLTGVISDQKRLFLFRNLLVQKYKFFLCKLIKIFTRKKQACRTIRITEQRSLKWLFQNKKHMVVFLKIRI